MTRNLSLAERTTAFLRVTISLAVVKVPTPFCPLQMRAITSRLVYCYLQS